MEPLEESVNMNTITRCLSDSTVLKNMMFRVSDFDMHIFIRNQAVSVTSTSYTQPNHIFRYLFIFMLSCSAFFISNLEIDFRRDAEIILTNSVWCFSSCALFFVFQEVCGLAD